MHTTMAKLNGRAIDRLAATRKLMDMFVVKSMVNREADDAICRESYRFDWSLRSSFVSVIRLLGTELMIIYGWMLSNIYCFVLSMIQSTFKTLTPGPANTSHTNTGKRWSIVTDVRSMASSSLRGMTIRLGASPMTTRWDATT